MATHTPTMVRPDPVARLPLKIDPVLWQALADDRVRFPWTGPEKDAALYIACPKCTRPTRGPEESAEDHPGTVRRVTTDGTCTSCWRLAKGRTGSRRRGFARHAPQNMPCPCCRKMTRHMAKTPDEEPGTVARHNNTGLCRSCYRAGKTAPAVEAA